MKKLFVHLMLLVSIGALGACASSGSSRDRAEDKSLAEKWDEEDRKQEERTRQPTAQERLDKATQDAAGGIGRSPVGRTTDGLIGR